MAGLAWLAGMAGPAVTFLASLAWLAALAGLGTNMLNVTKKSKNVKKLTFEGCPKVKKC